MSNFDAIIQRAAARHRVDPDLIRRVIQAESAGNPRAVSRVGARGLMQLMPGTAAGLGVKDSFNPEQNIEGGTRYLAEQLRRYKGRTDLALAAYNSGPGRVRDRVPNIPETQAYVRRILGMKTPTVSGGKTAMATRSTTVKPLSARSTGVRGAAVPAERRKRYDPLTPDTTGQSDMERYIEQVAALNSLPRTINPQASAQFAQSGAKTRYLQENLPNLQRTAVDLPEYTPPPMPVRDQVPIPQRGRVTEGFTPEVTAMTSLLSLFGGPNVGAAAFQGVQQANNRQYGDDLTNYQLRQQQEDALFSDIMRSRGEQMQLGLSDRDARYRQALEAGRQKDALSEAMLQIGADEAGNTALGGELNRQQGEQDAFTQAQTAAELIRQIIEQKRLASDQSIADDAAWTKEERDAAEFDARMKEYEANRNQRATDNEANRQMRGDIAAQNDETRRRGQDLAAAARERTYALQKLRYDSMRKGAQLDELKDADVKFAYQDWLIKERALSRAKSDFMTSDDPTITQSLEMDATNAYDRLQEARRQFKARTGTGTYQPNTGTPQGASGPGFMDNVSGILKNMLPQKPKPSTPSAAPVIGAPSKRGGKAGVAPAPNSIDGKLDRLAELLNKLK